VARHLATCILPKGVRVVDFGIGGFDLAYALLDGAEDVTILVDALPRGGTPGTVYLIEPDLADLGSADGESAVVDTHGMDPMKVLRLVRSMGGQPRRVLVVGCEPLTLGPDGGRIGLSATVEAAVDEATRLIESLVAKIVAGQALAGPISTAFTKGA
jgi:hydrogenase maturation protease